MNTEPKQLTNGMPDIGRTLPHSSDAERALIGSVLLSREVFDLATERGVTATMFHLPAHAILWGVLADTKDQKEMDFVTVTQTLKKKKLLEKVGGPIYITETFSFVPTAANWENYADIVRENWTFRESITIGTEIVARCYDGMDSPAEITQFAQASLLRITQTTKGATRSKTIHENVMCATEDIEKIQSGEIKSGLMTGLTALDKKLGGLHDGEVIILSGETGGGKTSLAHNIAVHAAVECRESVLMFSYEMPAMMVTKRMICSMAQINTELVRTGEINKEEMLRFSQYGQQLSGSKIFIEDDPDLTLLEMRTRARRRKATDDISLIIVDYLQKVPHACSNRNGSRQREVAEISDGIQKMAMELNIPVLALSQENKDGNTREASDISFDSKTLLKIRRDDAVRIEDEPLVTDRHILIPKNNNGSLGRVKVTFEKQFVKFVNYYDPKKLAEREAKSGRGTQRSFSEPNEND